MHGIHPIFSRRRFCFVLLFETKACTMRERLNSSLKDSLRVKFFHFSVFFSEHSRDESTKLFEKGTFSVVKTCRFKCSVLAKLPFFFFFFWSLEQSFALRLCACHLHCKKICGSFFFYISLLLLLCPMRSLLHRIFPRCRFFFVCFKFYLSIQENHEISVLVVS